MENKEQVNHFKVYRTSSTSVQTDGPITKDGPLCTDFNDEYFHQILETAVDTTVAPTCETFEMGYLEIELYQKCKQPIQVSILK